MPKQPLCIECNNYIDDKPLPRCKSSRFTDLVSGNERRYCLIERLDGIGRCSSMGNNFAPKGAETKKKPGRPKKDG